MRPTDENKDGSIRPNFLSSSRHPAGGEDSILARLARDGKLGTSPHPWKHARIAWSLLASVLVIGLIVALVSLTRENLALHRSPVLIEAKAAPYEPAAPALRAAVLERNRFAALPSSTASAKMSAAIAGLSTQRVMVRADWSAQLPPLVTLQASANEPAKPVLQSAKRIAASAKPSARPEAPVASRSARPRRAAKIDVAKRAPFRSTAAPTLCATGNKCAPSKLTASSKPVN